MNCDVIDGSIVEGIQKPILFSSIINNAADYKVFCEPETIHYKKNKSVSSSISFFLENDKHEEVNFNGETLTSTLLLIKS